MDCCQCEGIETRFDDRYVQKKLQKYRTEGPKETTRALIDAIKAESPEGAALLDIGGGIGDIEHALLGSEVRTATNVEASSAYLMACREEADRQGHAGSIDLVQGDFVEMADDLSPADIVTLDRVICCYPDMEALVQLSAEKAETLYGAVYPRNHWWVRLGSTLYYNLRFRLQGNPLRIYVHPTRRIEAILAANGLHPVFQRHMGTWKVALFRRA